MLTWTRPIRQLHAPFARCTAPASRPKNVTVLARRVLKDDSVIENPESQINVDGAALPSGSNVFSTCHAPTARDASEDVLVSHLEQEFQLLHENDGVFTESHGSFSSKRARRPIIAESFLELCRRRSRLLQGLSPNAVKVLIANAEASQINKVVGKLSSLYSDRLYSAEMDVTSAQVHFDAIQSALQHLLVDSSANAKHIIQLFEVSARFCDKYEFRPYLTPKSFAALAKIMSSRPERWYELNTTVIDFFVRYLRSLRLEWPVSQSQEMVQKPYKGVWWDVFALIKVLLDHGQHKAALSSIHALLERDVIPAQAIDDTVAASHFREFGLSVLVRACAHLHWAEGAARLLATENFSDMNLLSHYSVLINEVISTLLEGKPTASVHCAHIISHAWLQEPEIAIKRSLVHSVLVKCRETDSAGAAEQLLSALYDPRVRQYQRIRPTAPSYVTWLLHHLVDRRRDRTIGRLLVQDLISSKTPIEARVRPNVIAMCAEGGFQEEVLELWKRYGDGPEAKLVAGHARCMLAVIKLFGGTEGDGVREASDLEAGSSSPEQISVSSSTANGSVSMPPKDNPNDNLSDASEDTESVRAFPRVCRVPDFPRVETGASLGAVGRAADDLSRTQSNGRSNYSFALRVLAAFRAAKEPLQKASHYDLNAYARASAYVGHYRQSMRALQFLLQRREIPDQHDLHIPMSIMARDDPKAASIFLVDLLKQGARADSPILSAVILGAVRRDKKRLAVATYETLLSLGKSHSDMSSEAVGALLKIFLELLAGTKLAESSQFRRWTLQRARVLISDGRLHNTSFPSSVIERAVHTALAAGELDGVRSFWMALSRNQAWPLGERETLRLAIVESVRKAITKRTLEQVLGQDFLEELSDDGCFITTS